MESADPDEPEKKRPHLNSPSMARSSTTSTPNNSSVDAAVLHYQNQKLVHQIDTQKNELRDLETRIKELKEKQSSYDDALVSVNQLWNQLVDDLVLLGVRAGGGKDALQKMDHIDTVRGSIPSCSVENMFLCRLLQKDCIEVSGNREEMARYIEEALASRCASSLEMFEFLEGIIRSQKTKTEKISFTLNGMMSSEDVIIQLSKIDDMMEEEAKNLIEANNFLQVKREDYSTGIQTYMSSHLKNQSVIKSLTDELDESMAELEECRRKLVNLIMQKDVAVAKLTPIPSVTNGNLSPEKLVDRTIGLRELKDAIDETKILVADRLSELQNVRQENLTMSNQLQDLENELKDDKYVYSSRLYMLLNDQLQHWNSEVERYKALTDSLQAERSVVMRREKELNVEAQLAADGARSSVDNAISLIEELEIQLQKTITEKNDIEIKMEEAVQDSGRDDIKAEFRVMSSALSKEMEMMESQLKRWKDTAHEACSLRDEVQSLRTLLSVKTNEQKSLLEMCAQQLVEIKSLKALIEQLQKNKVELELFLDMYGQENNDGRSLVEIKESEHRAHNQAEVLKSALDEHSLELRVKAANEAEAACQQRLFAAETEIAELRADLDASERLLQRKWGVLELTEAIRIKDAEAEAYISEIEIIGQAYEDMQTQNQHLMQQVTERDDYNIKLVSESVKTKQAQSLLQSEKQALAKQLQQVTASLESLKARITQSEEEMKAYLTEAVKSTQEDKLLAVNMETGKWELADAEKDLKWLKSAVTSSEKEYEQIQQQIENIEIELESERSLRKKVEDELSELNNKVAEMTAETGEAAIQKLQNEINSCKSVLKCSVCRDRPKEVVIVKCYHLFCNPCIQNNLERRNRKCPGCGTAFGQNDVRFVKI